MLSFSRNNFLNTEWRNKRNTLFPQFKGSKFTTVRRKQTSAELLRKIFFSLDLTHYKGSGLSPLAKILFLITSLI